VRCDLGELPATVAAVVSNHPDQQGLAERFGVPFHHLPVGDDRPAQEAAVSALLDDLGPDLVVLARYMRVLPARLVERWANRMINIHHSFLPSFAGARPYAQAHDRGVKVIGATAHYVTAELDDGPIVAQQVLPVSHRDDPARLARRGRDVESVVLADAVRLHLERRIVVYGRRTAVFD
jgi:formyltetrahydrofolate deformylase